MAYAALFPAYPNEDYTTTITVGGLSPVNITGWTLVGAMFAPGAPDQPTGTVSTAITNASGGQVQINIIGQYLQPGQWAIDLYRTDTGVRTMVWHGLLEVTDPTIG